jgi:aromatic-amino-acid transaminase
MAGNGAFRQAVQDLLLGDTHRAVICERAATIQTVGASGALRIGAEFLKLCYPASEVWVSDPTWGNHHAIFQGAGFTVRSYPYLDVATGRADFAAMASCLGALPAHTIVLLHPCCHNPTGADLSASQWEAFAQMFKGRHLIPFFDLAYQGYAESVDRDRHALLAFTAAGVPLLVSNSFSKTFSLYGERCGALTVVSSCPSTSARVQGHLEKLVRKSYSSPPAYGAHIVAEVLGDPSLRAQWVAEVAAMRERIAAMRAALHARLSELRLGANFDYLLEQRGMFSQTGLSPSEVETLRERFAIYLVDNGRMCMTGLNTENVGRVAAALAPVLKGTNSPAW